MSLRRTSNGLSTTTPSRSLDDVLLTVNKGNVVPVGSVWREMYGVGVTRSSSNTGDEWKDDITKILDMFVERGYEGRVEVMERTDKGLALTDVSIAVSKKEMSIVKGYAIVETVKPENRGKLIELLKKHILEVLKLKLTDTVFRVFDL